MDLSGTRAMSLRQLSPSVLKHAEAVRCDNLKLLTKQN
jgi:hypothetical protein